MINSIIKAVLDIHVVFMHVDGLTATYKRSYFVLPHLTNGKCSLRIDCEFSQVDTKFCNKSIVGGKLHNITI